MYVHMCVYICGCVSVQCICTCVCKCIYVYMCMYICMHVCITMYVYLYVCVDICRHMERKDFCFCSLFEAILVHHGKEDMAAGGFRTEGARNGNVSFPRMFHMLAEQEAGPSTPSDPLLQRGYLSEPSLSETKTRTRPNPFHLDRYTSTT